MDNQFFVIKTHIQHNTTLWYYIPITSLLIMEFIQKIFDNASFIPF